jgi:hypothetical protein
MNLLGGKSILHLFMNVLIIILFLAAGLILGSHLVLKGIQKEHAIDVTLIKVEKIEHELEDIKQAALVNGNRISELDNTIKIHQQKILKDMENAKKHKMGKPN